MVDPLIPPPETGSTPLCSQSVLAQLKLGHNYHQKSNLAKARYHYQQALQLNQSRLNAQVIDALNPEALAEIHFNLALIYQTWGEWDLAAQHYQATIAVRPDDSDAYFNWALLSAEQGRYGWAAACYQHVIARQPDYLNAYINLGALWVRQQADGEAIALYQNAIARFPHSSSLHNNLGQVLHRQQDWDAAFIHYQKALILQPQFAKAHSNLGQLWLQQGDRSTAAGHFQQAATCAPSAQTLGEYAAIALTQGDFAGAWVALRQAIASSSQFVEWIDAYLDAYDKQALGVNSRMNGGSSLHPDIAVGTNRVRPGSLPQTHGLWETSHRPKNPTRSNQTRFNQAQQACAQWLRSLQQDDPQEIFEHWLFEVLIRSGAIATESRAFQRAEQLYHQAIALKPKATDLYGKLAHCLRHQSRPVAAQMLQALTPTEPEEPMSASITPPSPPVAASLELGCSVTCDRCMGDLIQAFRPRQIAAGVFQCDLKAGPQFPLPPQTLTQIPHGRAWVEPRQSDWVACHEVRVTTSDDRPIPELCRSYPWQLPNCKAQQSVLDPEQRCDRQSLPPSQTLTGTAVLLSTLSGHVYYHWMIDLLPRIGLLRRDLQAQKLAFDHIDHFIVNSLEAKFQRETLQHLGIPLEKVIESDRVPHLQAETLLVPSFPGQLDWIPPATIDFLRQQFLPKAAQNSAQANPKRIYINRQQARYRRVLNEDQILEILRPYGFVSVCLEELSVCEQAALFAQAEIIVAPHGSGLTNLVFCQPPTQILELFAPRYLRTDYWMVSQSLQLKHYYIVGRSLPCAPLRDLMYQSPLVEDIYVEPASLRSAIRQISP